MSALPILELPILVLMKILRIIDVETVIPISLCSRKMYHLVKTFRDKSDTLRLKMDGIDLRVQLATPDGNYHEVEVVAGTSETAERVKIDGHLVPIDRSRKHHGWNTYWDDKVKGMQSIMEYLSDLFGIKNVTTIIVTRGTMRLLDILKERQENDYELVIYHQLSEKESHFILENHPAKVLRIEGFSHNFPIAKHLKSIDSLIVGSKLSITLDDLLDMDCVELVLMETISDWLEHRPYKPR
ncbi:hypothetical protein CRE_15159 [Caenorhabditis remanei]|uniref:F-box domain-containing protein n=1 Tax=Caenorhabditis remanei TaxID=31234 RepID=E3NV31_CAERE|nr:hypothetical protein CRE_15159 [Caenorhabditis remanei]